MAIAAEHNKFEFNDYINPLPAEDLIKVAVKKQEMYDEGRKQIKQVYDQYGKIRSMIVNEDAKNYFDQELGKLYKNIQQNAGLDFANIGNVEAVINLGKPFENDEYIKNALDNGIEAQRRNAQLSSLSKEERSSDNDLVFMSDLNDYITKGGLDTKLSKNKSYPKYIDISAKMKEAAKEIEAEEFTTYRQGPRGYIEEVQHKQKRREELERKLKASLSPEEMAQLQIHAQADMIRLGNDAIYQTFVGHSKETKLIANQTRKEAMQELSRLNVRKPSAQQLAEINKLQNVIRETDDIIAAADETIGMNPDDFDMGEYLPFYTKRFIDGMASRLAYHQTKSELKEDKVYLQNLNHSQTLSEISARGREERKNITYSSELEYTTQRGASTGLLKGISKVLKPLQGGTKSSQISDAISQIQSNPNLKQSLKSKFIDQLTTLKNTYEYAESNQDRGLVVSINRGFGTGYTTSVEDFLTSDPLQLIESGTISSIEVRAKNPKEGKETKNPQQIKEEAKAKVSGELEAKTDLYKQNPEFAELLYGKNSQTSTGGGNSGQDLQKQLEDQKRRAEDKN